MKKVFGTLLALLAMAILALPPWFGRMAEDAVLAQAEEAPLPDYLDVEVVEYQRGWFSSRGTLELGLAEGYADVLRAAAAADTSTGGGTGDPSGEVAIRVQADVVHGPLGFRRGPFVGLAKGVMRPEVSAASLEEWRQRLDVPYLLEVHHRIGLGGASRFEVVVPPVDFEEDGLTVTLSGTEAWLEYEPDARWMEGRAAIETLEVSSDEANLQIESVISEGEGTLEGPGVLLGSGGLRVDRLSLVRPYETPARTDLVEFEATGSTNLSADGSALNSSLTYAVDTLVVGDTVSDARVRMSTLNIDRSAVEAYTGFTRRAALSGEELDDEAATEELGGLIHDFLAAEPAFEVDPVRFQFSGEPFEGWIRVTTDASELPERERFELLDPTAPGLWRRVFDVEAEVEISMDLARRWAVESQERAVRTGPARSGSRVPDGQIRSVAEEQADALLSSLVQGGLLTEDGDRYLTRLTFQGGRFTANGRPIPLPGSGLTP